MEESEVTIMDEMKTICLTAKSLGLHLLPQKRINLDSAVEWAESASKLLRSHRTLVSSEITSNPDNYYLYLHDIVGNLERVANYFQVLGEDCHFQFDYALADAYWFQMGSLCSLEKANYYFRRSGCAVKVPRARKKQQIYNLINEAEHYLDGIGVEQDRHHAESLFEEAGGLETLSDMNGYEILRICCRLYEYGLADAPHNLGQAAKLAVGLWELGFLSAGSEYLRLREYEGQGGIEDQDTMYDAEEDDATETTEAIVEKSPEKKDRKSKIMQDKRSAEDRIRDELANLNSLIGLASVKEQVGRLVAFERVQRLRLEQGIVGTQAPSRHVVLLGNPGTGKTTVARILAKIYHALGILQKDSVIETDRAGLVGGYLGQTAIKTQEVITSALDGVLFIDEAYSLTTADNDSFGKEAVNTLLKAMEDNRARLVVIVAGYTSVMKEFLKSNPGLNSRFNTTINFEDYSEPEMLEILVSMMKSSNFRLSDDALETAKVFFSMATIAGLSKDNARCVRNFTEKCIAHHASRITLENINEASAATKEDLMTVTSADASAAAIELGMRIGDTKRYMNPSLKAPLPPISKEKHRKDPWISPVNICTTNLGKWI